MREMMALLMEMEEKERYVLIVAIIIILILLIVIVITAITRKIYKSINKETWYSDAVSKKCDEKISRAELILTICLIAMSVVSIIVVRLLPAKDSAIELAIIAIGVIVDLICGFLIMYFSSLH